MRLLRARKVQPLEVVAGKGSDRKNEKDKARRELASADEPVRSEGEASKVSGKVFGKYKSSKRLALPFFRQLMQLHQSGMPIGDAVHLMCQRMTDPRMKDLSVEIYRDLSEGRTLAFAVRRFPEIFDEALSHLIEAGEATGNLVPILRNIIENLEEKAELQKRVVQSMAYPILIIFVAMGVVAMFLFFLLPRIQSMIDNLGGELNIAARLMIWLSEFSLKQGPFVVLGVILLVAGYIAWRKTPKGRIISDRWLLKTPMIKRLFYNADICRLTNVMGILLANGVNTTESMRLAENTVANRTLCARFQNSRTMVNDGAPFSAAFKRNALLPDLDIDILAVGESTGSLVNGFEEIYKTHSKQLQGDLKFITNLIAGGALMFAFGLVLILVLGIVTSILQLSNTLMTG